jgi:hypothetical protein
MPSLIPMACASAIYPSLLAAVVLIMGQPSPRRLLTAYLAGALVISIGSGLLIVFALEASEVASGSGDRFGPGVDVGIGAVALLLFWILLTDRDRRLRERRAERRPPQSDGGRDPWSRRILARGSLKLTFVLGMALSLPGALYLVALKDIAESGAGTAKSILWIVIYNAIMFSAAEIPLLGYAVRPEQTREAVDGANAWLGNHSRQVAMGLCAAAGAILLARGLGQLLG